MICFVTSGTVTCSAANTASSIAEPSSPEALTCTGIEKDRETPLEPYGLEHSLEQTHVVQLPSSSSTARSPAAIHLRLALPIPLQVLGIQFPLGHWFRLGQIWFPFQRHGCFEAHDDAFQPPNPSPASARRHCLSKPFSGSAAENGDGLEWGPVLDGPSPRIRRGGGRRSI